MIKDHKAFIKDNKEILNKIFQEFYDSEIKRIFLLPQGQERDVQIEFIKFLENWLAKIEIFSEPEKPEDKSFI